MITTPTVLVLGAGASKQYGFPTGGELTDALWHTDAGRERLAGELGFGNDLVRQFQEALRYSGQASVDAFLENRPEYLEVGKVLIAIYLVARESTDHMFQDHRTSWYHLLFQAMRPLAFAQFGENRLSIITFNYDRSLEQFLYTCLVNTYNQPPDAVAEQLARIPFVHVYGQLGPLEWQGDRKVGGKRKYRSETEALSIRIAADGIKIMAEHRENTPEFIEANRLLCEAKVIRFVGFGYDPINTSRLQVPWRARPDDNSYEISGTAKGLTGTEIARLTSRYKGLCLDNQGMNAYEFFRAYGTPQ